MSDQSQHGLSREIKEPEDAGKAVQAAMGGVQPSGSIHDGGSQGGDRRFDEASTAGSKATQGKGPAESTDEKNQQSSADSGLGEATTKAGGDGAAEADPGSKNAAAHISEQIRKNLPEDPEGHLNNAKDAANSAIGSLQGYIGSSGQKPNSVGESSTGMLDDLPRNEQHQSKALNEQEKPGATDSKRGPESSDGSRPTEILDQSRGERGSSDKENADKTPLAKETKSPEIDEQQSEEGPQQPYGNKNEHLSGKQLQEGENTGKISDSGSKVYPENSEDEGQPGGTNNNDGLSGDENSGRGDQPTPKGPHGLEDSKPPQRSQDECSTKDEVDEADQDNKAPHKERSEDPAQKSDGNDEQTKLTQDGEDEDDGHNQNHEPNREDQKYAENKEEHQTKANEQPTSTGLQTHEDFNLPIDRKFPSNVEGAEDKGSGEDKNDQERQGAKKSKGDKVEGQVKGDEQSRDDAKPKGATGLFQCDKQAPDSDRPRNDEGAKDAGDAENKASAEKPPTGEQATPNGPQKSEEGKLPNDRKLPADGEESENRGNNLKGEGPRNPESEDDPEEKDPENEAGPRKNQEASSGGKQQPGKDESSHKYGNLVAAEGGKPADGVVGNDDNPPEKGEESKDGIQGSNDEPGDERESPKHNALSKDHVDRERGEVPGSETNITSKDKPPSTLNHAKPNEPAGEGQGDESSKDDKDSSMPRDKNGKFIKSDNVNGNESEERVLGDSEGRKEDGPGEDDDKQDDDAPPKSAHEADSVARDKAEESAKPGEKADHEDGDDHSSKNTIGSINANPQLGNKNDLFPSGPGENGKQPGDELGKNPNLEPSRDKEADEKTGDAERKLHEPSQHGSQGHNTGGDPRGQQGSQTSSKDQPQAGNKGSESRNKDHEHDNDVENENGAGQEEHDNVDEPAKGPEIPKDKAIHPQSDKPNEGGQQDVGTPQDRGDKERSDAGENKESAQATSEQARNKPQDISNSENNAGKHGSANDPEAVDKADGQAPEDKDERNGPAGDDTKRKDDEGEEEDDPRPKDSQETSDPPTNKSASSTGDTGKSPGDAAQRAGGGLFAAASKIGEGLGAAAAQARNAAGYKD